MQRAIIQEILSRVDPLVGPTIRPLCRDLVGQANLEFEQLHPSSKVVQKMIHFKGVNMKQKKEHTGRVTAPIALDKENTEERDKSR